METNKSTVTEYSLIIVKWFFAIVFIGAAIGVISDKAFIAATAFLLIGLLLLPPLKRFWIDKLPLLEKRPMKLGLLAGLVIAAALGMPNKDKVTPSITGADSEKDKVTFDNEGNRKSKEANITPKSAKRISGITPVDVYGNFEKQGFRTDKQITASSAMFTNKFEENGIQYTVETFCENGVTDVSAVDLNAVRIDPQYNEVMDMKKFLKYGCSIPYDGNDIEKIHAFIDENYFTDKATIVISKVRFTIYVPTEFARIISIESE